MLQTAARDAQIHLGVGERRSFSVRGMCISCDKVVERDSPISFVPQQLTS